MNRTNLFSTIVLISKTDRRYLTEYWWRGSKPSLITTDVPGSFERAEYTYRNDGTLNTATYGDPPAFSV